MLNLVSESGCLETEGNSAFPVVTAQVGPSFAGGCGEEEEGGGR